MLYLVSFLSLYIRALSQFRDHYFTFFFLTMILKSSLSKFTPQTVISASIAALTGLNVGWHISTLSQFHLSVQIRLTLPPFVRNRCA